MAECIMVGCDLHDKSMLLKIAVDRGAPMVRSWGTDASARVAMIADLKRRAAQGGARRILFAYEACGFGFLLHDELSVEGIDCHVLAPSKMERSAKHRKSGTRRRSSIRFARTCWPGWRCPRGGDALGVDSGLADAGGSGVGPPASGGGRGRQRPSNEDSVVAQASGD